MISRGGIAALLSVGVGCGFGVHVGAGPSIIDGRPGATAAIDAEVHWGELQRSVVFRYRVGGGYHSGVGGTFVVGFAVGLAWADGRWSGGAGMTGQSGGEDEAGLTFSGEVHYAPLRTVAGSVGTCGPGPEDSWPSYSVRDRQLRVGVLAGAGPGATFAWLPVSLGGIWWRPRCPVHDVERDLVEYLDGFYNPQDEPQRRGPAALPGQAR